jgi:hypothetical protein
MKSAYELAMERLNRTTPIAQVTPEQKQQLAEVDSRFRAKIAELEIHLRGEVAAALAAGKAQAAVELEQRLVAERSSLQAQLEEAKERIRQAPR